MVSRIAILFLAAVPPKLMAKDKKDSSSPERAMDERREERGRNKGSENGAAEKEYQMGTQRTEEEVYVFCLEAEGFSPRSEEED